MFVPCSVPGCNGMDTIYSFPYHDKELLKAWVNALSNPEFNHSSCMDKHCEYHELCKKHFEDRYIIPGRCYLLPGAIPTLHLPAADTQKEYNMNYVLKDASLTPGTPNVITEHLQFVFNNLSDLDKYCIITFEEIKLRPGLHYNKEMDFVEGFVDTGDRRYSDLANRALVFMACGITRKWQLPISFIYFNDEVGYAKENYLILEQINFLHLEIVAVVGEQNKANIEIIKHFTEYNHGSNKYISHFNIADKYNEGSILTGATIKEEIPLKDTPEILLHNFNREPITKFIQKIYDSCDKNSYPDFKEFTSSFRNACVEMFTDLVGKTCKSFCSQKAWSKFYDCSTSNYWPDDRLEMGVDCPPTGHGYNPKRFTFCSKPELTNLVVKTFLERNENCEGCLKVFICEEENFKPKPFAVLVVPRKKYKANTFAEFINYFYGVIYLELCRFISGVGFIETLTDVFYAYCNSSKIDWKEIKCSKHRSLAEDIVRFLMLHELETYIKSINLCFEGKGISWKDGDRLERMAIEMHNRSKE